MKRNAIVAASAVMLILIAAAAAVSNRYRSAELDPTELASKPISVPLGWANDCSRIKRTVAESRGKLAKNTGRLSDDEVAIYKEVLTGWNAGSRTVLNVSNRTVPLDGSSSSIDLSNCECLDGLEPTGLVRATRSFHSLTRGFLPAGENIRLVDADTHALNDPSKQIGEGKPIGKAVDRGIAAGLFSLSEIAFDREHRHALVSYSFVCGSLCGSGAVLLFEKVNGDWKKSSRDCGGWIS